VEGGIKNVINVSWEEKKKRGEEVTRGSFCYERGIDSGTTRDKRLGAKKNIQLNSKVENI